jgi:hypothetical protein
MGALPVRFSGQDNLTGITIAAANGSFGRLRSVNFAKFTFYALR